LKLYSLGAQTQADPFPPINPKYFTADSPSVSTVEGYLKAMLGFDPNRIWRVAAIQKTPAAGVSKVTALVSEKGPNAKVLTAVFFVLPDGKHLIANDAAGVSPFGAEPFAENRAILQAKANGPSRGSASKDLMIVEFADLQCPHCKDAQPTMDKLVKDFPKAHFVFESFPLTDIHPYAFQAATYGACIAKQGADAFYTYAQAVYDTQGALLPDTATQTLNNAATKAGADPTKIAFCANSDAAKAEVNASTALATELNIDSTPMLSVNGRMIGLNAVPYETLKSLIQFQAELDGVSAAAAAPAGSGVDLKSHDPK
jgi:protein-disulfide isomerase